MKIRFYFKRLRRRKVKRKTNQKDFLMHKENARLLAKTRLEYFNRHYKFKIGRISIRNTRSRWGSCSSKGNLNFNYRIFSLSSELSDYIIVHELCHLGQFNHSNKFWDLVGETLPNYLNLQKELKKIRIG